MKEIKAALKREHSFLKVAEKPIRFECLYDWVRNSLVQNKRYKRLNAKRKTKQI